jgi:hypothetical protein
MSPALDFYATADYESIRPYMPDNVPFLLPCSSWAKVWKPGPVDGRYPRGPIPPPLLPEHVTHVAADSGGFVATVAWGDYKYLTHHYVNWCRDIGPALRWAALPDYCCEPEIADDPAEIATRQRWTTERAESICADYLDVPWAWAPTIQGWDVDDYRRHARELAPLISWLDRYYAQLPDTLWDADGEPSPAAQRRAELAGRSFRVGIGTLCRRASVEQIRRVVDAVADELPGIPLHLWGVKLGAIQQGLPPEVVSVDSAAWNGRFGSAIEAQRSSGMTQRYWGYRVALPEYLEKVDRATGHRRPPAGPCAPEVKGARPLSRQKAYALRGGQAA